MTVRVRFAPSPTGFLHVGGARTALFNWLFARRHGGTFVVRVEDTDTARERPEFRAEIFRALSWLGIDEDEGPSKGGAFGPYTQSERGRRYAAALEELIRRDAVFPCFCSTPAGSPDAAEPEPQTYAQPRCRCATLDAAEIARLRAQTAEEPALRLRVDQTRPNEVRDLIRGTVVFPPGEVEEFLVAKSGRLPLYNFAAVVDDAAMHITHVIRGEEHLANTPKQILLYQALGYAVPQFAHLPIILNTERRKLSKRDGATAVSDYRKAGYVPAALRNFLALLGWSPGGDREIMALDDMIAAFDFARVQKSGAVFDTVKLTWMNGEYLKTMMPDELVPAVLELLDGRPDAAQLRRDHEHVRAVCAMLRERAKTIAEIAGQTYLFSTARTLEWDPAAVEKRAGDRLSRERLAAVAQTFAGVEDFTREPLEAALRVLAESQGVKAGDLIGPLRVALTGVAVSPGIFELCEVLGKAVVLARIAAFLHAFPIEVTA